MTRIHRPAGVVLAITLAGAGLVTTMPQAAAAPARADLRVDANRDGGIDLAGAGDQAGEDAADPFRGALFLPNIDDDAKRCRMTGPGGRPLSDAELTACNDGSDTKVNGAQDARDLARLRTVPAPETLAGAEGRVRVTGRGAQHTRLFVKRGTAWERVTASTRLTARELRAGVELGLEGTDIVRDRAKWDGRAVVELTVTRNDVASTDTVTLRVAPLLTHHPLQGARQLMVSKISGDDTFAREQRKFVKGLAEEVRKAGIDTSLITFKDEDIWAQDFLEPAYATVAGPGGRPHGMRILLRSAQPDREGGRRAFALRGPGTGAVQVTGVRSSEEWTLNSMGNLETIPPYAHGGRSYPAGRIIQGWRKDSGSKPARAMRTLLESQGVQDPLLLDTSWLGVGHVDEFIQFLPADTPRGWRIAVADPDAGMRLLRDAQRAGHGGTKVFSVKGVGDAEAPQETIDQALASRNLAADNTLAAQRIRANLEILERETGVTDAEIVKVPALFTRGTTETAGSPRLPLLERMGAGGELPRAVGEYGQQRHLGDGGGDAAEEAAPTSAYIPGAVNGILLARDRYLAPRQWGPVIGGKDVFTEAVTRAYRRAGMKVSYIDDFFTYHVGLGEIHCGTNTLRDIRAPWWR